MWKEIADLHEDLCMRIEFREPKAIRQREAAAAAAAFCGMLPLDSVAERDAYDIDHLTTGLHAATS